MTYKRQCWAEEHKIAKKNEIKMTAIGKFAIEISTKYALFIFRQWVKDGVKINYSSFKNQKPLMIQTNPWFFLILRVIEKQLWLWQVKGVAR